MKSIILHTAALDNSGERHEAGDVLVVGNGKTAITDVRAGKLLARHLCSAVPAKKVASPE